MIQGERHIVRALGLQAIVLGVALVAAVPRSQAVMDATTECLVDFGDVPDADKNGGVIQCTDCDPACDVDGVNTPNKSCTFKLKVCVNEADATCTATALKTVRVKGRCGASVLRPVPSGASPTCGTEGSLVVKLKKRGKKPGKCKVMAQALSSGKPRRKDKDVLTLVCNPRPAGQACPSTTGCVPTGNEVCAPLVNDGQGIAGTYQMLAQQGSKLCQTNSRQNRFGPCSTDADCGGGSGNCVQPPWATADGVVLPFPQGIKTTFTIAAEDPAPTCNHSACIACTNADAVCAGIPGCGSTPGQPAPGCIRNQCCGSPGFTIPTFLVPLLGGLCSRLDQYRCGFGAVNSSNPQVGDNEVTKTADTSDPGADCCYNNDPNAADCVGGVNNHDDPAAKPCNTGGSGAGNDIKGKVIRTVGNGQCDLAGINYRMAVPSLSTTWQDAQSPQGQCLPGSTFDPGELIITQLNLNAEFSTAGATSSFADLNGDGCARAGAGFTNFNQNGPFTLGPPPAAPQPYDSSTCPPGGVCSTAVAAGVAITGGGPLFDTGFVAVLTNGAMTRLPTESCPCAQVNGCPE